MTEQTAPSNQIEDVASFQLRARAWLAANMPRLPEQSSADAAVPNFEEDAWLRSRELQQRLYSGGFAGICFPKDYGGLGLTPEHQRAFNEEATGYEMPLHLNVTTFSICGATILDMGSEELKRQHLSAIIRGEEVIVQFLSEPHGGSDLASVRTRAVRRGDMFVVNGSKIWSSYAYAADYALCLVRTNWDVPKHRGLSMLLMKVRQPGVTVRRIKQINGNMEFCQEFFDDVEVPVSNVVGQIDDGWTVALRLLSHERNTVGGGSPYASGTIHGPRTDVSQYAPSVSKLKELVRETGQSGDALVRELVAESHVLERVQEHLIDRISTGMKSGQMSPHFGTIIRLFSAVSEVRRAEIGIEVAGPYGVFYPEDRVSGREFGDAFLMRQSCSLGGGSTEMSRNIISERILEMPREQAPDRDVPFSQVRQGTS